MVFPLVLYSRTEPQNRFGAPHPIDPHPFAIPRIFTYRGKMSKPEFLDYFEVSIEYIPQGYRMIAFGAIFLRAFAFGTILVVIWFKRLFGLIGRHILNLYNLINVDGSDSPRERDLAEGRSHPVANWLGAEGTQLPRRRIPPPLLQGALRP